MIINAHRRRTLTLSLSLSRSVVVHAKCQSKAGGFRVERARADTAVFVDPACRPQIGPVQVVRRGTEPPLTWEISRLRWRAPGLQGFHFCGLGVQRMLRIRLYALMEPFLDLIISPGRVLLSRVWSATQSAGTAKAGRNSTFHL